MYRKRWMDFDFGTPLMLLILSAIGLLTIYSATFQSRGMIYVHRQTVWILLGLVVGGYFTVVSYERWLQQAPWIYAGALSLLVLTLAFGHTLGGSRSWLVLGPFNLQTAEVAKIAVALMWARIFGGRPQERLRDFRWTDFVGTTAVAVVPMGLILLQPDFGTALTFCLPLVMVWILLRMPLRYWMLVLLIMAVALPLGWEFLQPYQKARILVFMQQSQADPTGPAYQVIQSRIALGSAGFFGKGFQRGSQTQLGFVPERHTDFVMTTLGEEWGFVGVAVVFFLFLILFYRWLGMAQAVPDPSGQMLMVALAGFWIFHFFINTGMVIGWAPVTGLPLPLISYGGSFTLFCFASAGIIVNIYWMRNIVFLRRYG